MLARGEPLELVLATMLGRDDGGKVWLDKWRAVLSAVPCKAHRRAIVEHWLRTFEGARRHGAQWRVVDSLGFVGRRTELVSVEQVDESTGEVTTREKRRHVPAPRAGGLAAQQSSRRKGKRSGVAPRTLDRYRRTMRAGRLIASKQPPRNTPDAVMPSHDDAQWAYGQLWLALPPTREMIARWEAHPAPATRARSRTAARKARALDSRPFEALDFPLPY